jgi:hypothetical protein
VVSPLIAEGSGVQEISHITAPQHLAWLADFRCGDQIPGGDMKAEQRTAVGAQRRYAPTPPRGVPPTTWGRVRWAPSSAHSNPPPPNTSTNINDQSRQRIRQSIADNPLRWHLDRENPTRTGAAAP